MNWIRERGRKSYGVALILLVISMAVIMAMGSGLWWDVVSMTLLGLALVALVRAAGAREMIQVGVTVLILLAIVATWLQALLLAEIDPAVVPTTTVALVVIATPVVTLGLIRQVRASRKATVHTMLGVLCIYLLISLAFASGFALAATHGGGQFFAEGPEWDSLRNYLYFSLTTITTAGLGDLAPGTDLGRSLTAIEALIGQIYLVTVVAVIVSNIGRPRA